MPTRTPLFLSVVAGIFLTGCITGERPTLVDEPATVVEDPAVLGVLDRLTAAGDSTFTATYRIIPSLTGNQTEATVQVVDGRRRVLIGNVEYLSDGENARTCESGVGGCVDFLDQARISNLNITDEFWGDAFAARLRLDASRRVGFIDNESIEVAGLPAACVDIPLPSTGAEVPTVRYCALDQGPLARYFGADVSIELTSYQPTSADISF